MQEPQNVVGAVVPLVPFARIILTQFLHKLLSRETMDISSEIRSTSIVAPISYIASLPKYDKEIPYYLLDVRPTTELPSTNIQLVTKDVSIKDMRADKVGMSLEADGFQLFDWPQASVHIGSDYDEVERYCKDMAKMVARELGAEEAFVFDFRVEYPKPVC